MAITLFEYQIDGKTYYAAQNSYDDTLEAIHHTRDEIIEWWGDRARQRAIRELTHEFDLHDKDIPQPFISANENQLKKAIRDHLKNNNPDDEEMNSVKTLLSLLQESGRPRI